MRDRCIRFKRPFERNRKTRIRATFQQALSFPDSGRNNMATKKKSTGGAAKKKSAKKSTGRKYSPGASKSVEREMKAMKKGKLKSGRSGKKVTNPKQAVAMGLSEARKKGAKVPEKKS